MNIRKNIQLTDTICTIRIGLTGYRRDIIALPGETAVDLFDRAVEVAESMLRTRARVRSVEDLGYLACSPRVAENDAVVFGHDGDEWFSWATAHLRGVL